MSNPDKCATLVTKNIISYLEKAVTLS